MLSYLVNLSSLVKGHVVFCSKKIDSAKKIQLFLTLNKFLSMAGECKRETVVVPSDSKNGSLPGVLFGNPSVSPRGLIVNHEWWRMRGNQQIQDEGAAIARDGNLTVLVVDHYRTVALEGHQKYII